LPLGQYYTLGQWKQSVTRQRIDVACNFDVFTLPGRLISPYTAISERAFKVARRSLSCTMFVQVDAGSQFSSTASSQTVVLDAAVLPLTQNLVMRIGRSLNTITKRGICSIKVDSAELTLWRQVLPAFAERCRDWQHQSSCEFKQRTDRVMRDANDVLCSCGKGRLPMDFVTGLPHWDDVAKSTTRIASLC
jgi:hypothetical protein